MLQLAALQFLLITLAPHGASLAIEPCDLTDPARDHSHVVVSVRLLFTMHGPSILPAVGCKAGPSVWAQLSFPEEGNPVVDFALETGSREKLAPFYRLQGAPTIACATLDGQLIVTKHFRSRRIKGQLFGNGFGETGMARSALVVQRVVDVRPCVD
jgi:hypothetical protein